MRKVVVAMALATTALAGPALARDKAWYVGAEAGPNLTQNEQFDVTQPATLTSTASVIGDGLTVRDHVGYDVGGVLGYDFGPIRAEFEVGYKSNKLDTVTVNQALPALRLPNSQIAVPPLGTYNGQSAGAVSTGADNAGGHTRVLSFMGNLLYDFGGHADKEVGAYLGGGVGIARVQHSLYQFQNYGAAFLDDSDTGFAWQIIAGVYKPITKHIDVGLKYRFFTVPNVKTFTTNGIDTETRYRSHSLLLTVSYNFFTEVPPPPPPPAAAPPAPAPAPLPPCPPAAVTPGPFLVFFDWDKSLITAEAAQILDRAAEQYAATGQTSVSIGGYTDKSGKDDYNMRLSQRRADAVKAYLATKGVPDTAMVTEAFGETRPLVDTADGVREPQNRRAEITFSGAPAPATGPCTPQ